MPNQVEHYNIFIFNLPLTKALFCLNKLTNLGRKKVKSYCCKSYFLKLFLLFVEHHYDRADVPGDGDDVGGLLQAPHIDGVSHRVPVLAHVISEPVVKIDIRYFIAELCPSRTTKFRGFYHLYFFLFCISSIFYFCMNF